MHLPNIGGIVLCGGASRRMGRPKASLAFGSETMLQRVVGVLREVVDPVVVVAAPGQEVPSLPTGVRLARDDRPGRGPLEGIAAGLAALEGQAEAAYVSSCDVPLLQAAFVRRLAGLLGDRWIAVPEVDGYRQPLAAVYRLDVLPTVRRLLAEDRLRPLDLFDEAPTRIVTADELRGADPELVSLRNVNTPEDYAAALRHLGG